MTFLKTRQSYEVKLACFYGMSGTWSATESHSSNAASFKAFPINFSQQVSLTNRQVGQPTALCRAGPGGAHLLRRPHTHDEATLGADHVSRSVVLHQQGIGVVGALHLGKGVSTMKGEGVLASSGESSHESFAKGRVN